MASIICSAMRWLWLAAIALVSLSAGPAADPAVTVIVRTELGDLEIEVDATHAPVTVANFLRYVDGKQYDGGAFHRTVTPANQPNDAVKIAVIQAGASEATRAERFPPIPLERTNQTGLKHLDGTISMARGAAADTARSDFFICIGNQPSLDFGGKRNPDGQGFAAFGRVTRGMDIVRKIQQGAAEGQRLNVAVRIQR